MKIACESVASVDADLVEQFRGGEVQASGLKVRPSTGDLAAWLGDLYGSSVGPELAVFVLGVLGTTKSGQPAAVFVL